MTDDLVSFSAKYSGGVGRSISRLVSSITGTGENFVNILIEKSDISKFVSCCSK